MLRRIIYLDTETGSELVMPVTPREYQSGVSRDAEKLDMAYFSQVNLPGLMGTYERSETYLLPAQPYPFGLDADPQHYLDWLSRRCQDGTVCRYIVSGTDVNDAVLLTDVQAGERDGTNDVYVTVTRLRYVELQTEVSVHTQNLVRTSETKGKTGGEQSYTVKAGDCLWDICRTYYGDGSLCCKLAAYNAVPNANLIYAGQTLKLPDAGTLGGVSAAKPQASADQGKKARETLDAEKKRIRNSWQVKQLVK